MDRRRPAPTDIPKLPRGARPTPRHLLAAAAPFRRSAAHPPVHLKVPAQLSDWGNLRHHCCVTTEEAFAKACQSPAIRIREQTVLRWAREHGVLEGAASLHEVLTWMRASGFRQARHRYDDGPFYALDWTDPALLANAIFHGPVKVGVAADQLEAPWHGRGGRSGWVAVKLRPDANEDHCASLCGYGPLGWLARRLGTRLPRAVAPARPGYALFTWGSIGLIDRRSLHAIAHEAWVRSPTTQVSR